MEEDELPRDWDPLGLGDQPLDPDDTFGGGTGFAQETSGGVSAYPAPPSLPTGTEEEEDAFVKSFLAFDDFSDDGGSALTGGLASSDDVTDEVTDEKINELLKSYFDSSSEPHTPGVETPTHAIPAPQVTAESVFDKLTRKVGGNYVLTVKARNQLLDTVYRPDQFGGRTLENFDDLRTYLANLAPNNLDRLNKKIDQREAILEKNRIYARTKRGQEAQQRAQKRFLANRSKTELESAVLRLEKIRKGRFEPTDFVVDGGVGKPLRVVPVTALMGAIFAAVAVIAAVLAELNGWGGSESEKKLRAGAAGLGDGAEQSGSVTAQQGGWAGRAAEAYDTDSATLAGLSAVMADTDTTTAALLQAHDQRLETTRTVIDTTDALLTVSDPIAVALDALPATGPALSVAFQLSVAIPALHACYSAEQHALHSSARTAAALQDAAATYRHIRTTATQLTSLT